MTNRNVPIYHHEDRGGVDLWQSLNAPFCSIAPIGPDADGYEYTATSWLVDTIVFSETNQQGMASQRNAWQVDETGDQICLYRLIEGQSIGHVSDQPFEQKSGETLLIDYSNTMDVIQSACRVEAAYIPYESLNYDPEFGRALTKLDPESAIGRLIDAELTHMFNHLRQGNTSLPSSSIQRFLGCVSFALSPHLSLSDVRSQSQQALHRAILAYVEANLQSATLSVDSILANFGTSRASLYRMFDDEGGVRNYITRRRLLRALIEIAQNPKRRGQIHAAAERWGFSSDANFNRTVRRHFGMSPGTLFSQPFQHQPLSVGTPRTRELLEEIAQRAA